MIRLDIRTADGTFVKTVEGKDVADALSEYYDYTLAPGLEDAGEIDPVEHNGVVDPDTVLWFGPEE